MKKSLNVAVLGLGTMGEIHASVWARIPNVHLVGVAARRPEKAEAIAKQYGAKAYTDVDEMYKQQDIDVVDICLPTDQHLEYVTKAAQAGKHVICEKPLGLDVEEAQRMISVCQQKGVKLFGAHVVRFFPEYAQAHTHIKAGKVGQPGVVRLTRGGPFPQTRDNWYADQTKSGGLILDMMTHDFDWLRWTFGDVERIMARHVLREDETHPLEYALVTLRMVDGTIAHVEGTWSHTEFRTAYEITGDRGMLNHDSRESAPLSVDLRESSSNSEDQRVTVPESPLNKGPYERQLEHFAECLLTGKEPIVTAHDALKAVEIARAAIKSAQTGAPVQLVNEEKVRI